MKDVEGTVAEGIVEETIATTSVIDEASVIENFLKSQKYIDLLNAEKGGAVKKFQDEKLEGLVKERIDAKAHKEPWEIQMEEMKLQMNVLKNEKANEVEAKQVEMNKSTALKALTDANLPSGLVEFLVSADTEKTTLNVGKMTEVIAKYLQEIKENGLKANNVVIPTKNATAQVGKITIAETKGMSRDEISSLIAKGQIEGM